jgi:hypothetical protein
MAHIAVDGSRVDSPGLSEQRYALGEIARRQLNRIVPAAKASVRFVVIERHAGVYDCYHYRRVSSFICKRFPGLHHVPRSPGLGEVKWRSDCRPVREWSSAAMMRADVFYLGQFAQNGDKLLDWGISVYVNPKRPRHSILVFLVIESKVLRAVARE